MNDNGPGNMHMHVARQAVFKLCTGKVIKSLHLKFRVHSPTRRDGAFDNPGVGCTTLKLF